jgi:hypothetical protein
MLPVRQACEDPREGSAESPTLGIQVKTNVGMSKGANMAGAQKGRKEC